MPPPKQFFGNCSPRESLTFFLDASQAWALGWPGPRTRPAGHFFYRTSAAKSHLNSCSHFWSRRPRATARGTPGATPVATPGATPGPPWGNARGKHFTKNAPTPQKVASRAGETPTCENEIVSGVGPNSFPKQGPRYLATLPSFLTTCPHINQILENAHGDIF